MAEIALVTHEIGSLAKPMWRSKAFQGQPLLERDVLEASEWGEKLEIPNYEALLKILAHKHDFSSSAKEEILRFSSLYATRFLEKAGLDLVWDGEQHRVEMYEYAINHIQGFAFHGHVRSFDNKYYRRASCLAEPQCERPYHVQEYEQIASFASKPVKIPLTGAYTLMDWSYDAHYISTLIPGQQRVQQQRHQAREAFMQDLAKHVINPNIQALYDKGARYIQIDEPAATTKRDETAAFLTGLRQSIGDLAGKAFFSIHICFSEYKRLFPAIEQLQGFVNEIHFEYANRDTRELGHHANRRLGYEILHDLKNTSFVVGLGVLDVHTDFIEPPELVRDRILYAHSIIQDPSRLYIAPDCGLRTRSWEVAFQKLQNMVSGRNLAAQELGLQRK